MEALIYPKAPMHARLLNSQLVTQKSVLRLNREAGPMPLQAFLNREIQDA